ncbi:MAG: DUF1365 domain-containing protein [Rhizobiaceae bacterium]|nr:DUF1365 domain-containing protein [Rhizobiaceae bacterium]
MSTERITTMTDNGPSPEAAAVLYPGEVMHQRLRPFGHRFTYKVFSLLVDIDRLDEADRMSPLLSVNKPNLVSFRETDQTERDGETLRSFADRLLADAGLETPATRILLLSYPRIFGYAFNPISVYFAYGAAGELLALIYAVRNTFGERHTYVARIEPGDLSEAGVRQTRAKLFHVSPFIGMEARYHFRILPPGRTVRLRIHETERDEALLAATFAGTARQLTTSALAANLLRIPFMTWKIMAGIHWEALKLWLKGARFHKSPQAPHPVSFSDGGSRHAR